MAGTASTSTLLLVYSTDCRLEEGRERGVFEKLVRARVDHYRKLYDRVVLLSADERDMSDELGGGVIHLPVGRSHPGFVLSGAAAVRRLASSLTAVRVYGPVGIVPVALGLASVRSHPPVVLSLEYDWLGQMRRHRSPFLGPFASQVYRMVVRHSDRIITSTDLMRQRLEAQGARPGQVEVLPNWVELPDKASDRARARKRLAERHGVPEDGRLVVYVGRLAEIKRVDDLVRAVAGLSGIRLVACGDGPELEALVSLADKEGADATFLGAVPSGEVPDVLAAGDVFAMASEEEGMPFALIEAMGAGLPVVATDVEGIANVLPRDGGLLVQPRSPRKLRTALARVADDPELAARMGAVNREAAAPYGREAVFEREDAILRDAGALP